MNRATRISSRRTLPRCAEARESSSATRLRSRGLSQRVTWLPSWHALHIEVYGGPSTKAEGADGTLATYNAERHAMLATVPDSGKGAEVALKYERGTGKYAE